MKSALIAIVLFAALATWHGRIHLRDGGWAFASDSAYLDQKIATHLIREHVHGVAADHPVPALRNTLWRFVVSPMAGTPNAVLFTIAVSLAFAAGALMASISIARHLHPSAALAAGVLAAVGSSLAIAAWSGTPETFAAALLAGAVAMHIRSFDEGEDPLSTSSALLLGLAALLRLEYAGVWLLLWLHAFLVAGIRQGRGETAVVLFRGMNGFFMIGLLCAPLIAINLRTIGVPWPMQPGIGGWAGFGSAYRQALGFLHGSPVFQTLALKWLVWAGLATILVDFLRDRSRIISVLPLILYVLSPFIYVCASALLGWDGASGFFNGLSLVWLAVAARGVMALTDGIAWGLGRAAPGTVKPLTSPLLAVVVTALVAVLSLPAFAAASKEAGLAVKTQVDARENLERVALGKLRDVRVPVTDQPGWILFRSKHSDVVDLTGETTMHVLALVGPGGKIDLDGLKRLVAERHADALVLWGDKFEDMKATLGGLPVDMGLPTPYVARLTTSAVP